MLSDKVCIVAGTGHGLGKAAAVELGKQGATVVVNDLGVDVTGKSESSEPAEETFETVTEIGGDRMVHFEDVSSLDYTETLVRDTYDEHGQIDGVANFAGILRDKMSGEE